MIHSFILMARLIDSQANKKINSKFMTLLSQEVCGLIRLYT